MGASICYSIRIMPAAGGGAKRELETTIMKSERMLDADLNIYIGVTEELYQVIHIDRPDVYYKLLYFVERKNQLTYEFENEIIMIIEKKENII